MGARVLRILPVLLLLTACRAQLPGEDLERHALQEEGEEYVKPFEERSLPPVNPDSPYGDLIARAVHADPEIEMAYFEWASRFHRAIAVGTPPDPTFGLGWMFDDPLESVTSNFMALVFLPLPAPEKRQAEARVAWEEMRAARQRYDVMTTVRRGRFRQVYSRFDRAAREAEIAEREIELLQGLETNLTHLAGSGRASAPDLLRIRLELEQARDRAAEAQAALRTARVNVNTAMSRGATEPLDTPPPLEPLHLDATDEAILSLALERNPDMVTAEGAARAAREGLGRAESQDNADFAFQYERQFANQYMVQFTLPLQRDRIHALLGEARANLAKAEAERRKTRNDVASETMAAYIRFREAERRQALVAGRLKPLASAAFDALVVRFGAGSASFLDLVEAKRALLEIEREEAFARTERDDALGDLLACCGAEIPSSSPQRAGAVAMESGS